MKPLIALRLRAACRRPPGTLEAPPRRVRVAPWLAAGLLAAGAAAQDTRPAAAPAAAPAADAKAPAANPPGGVDARPRLQTRALTPSELDRLEKITLEKGSSVPLPENLVRALKMTPRQVAPTVRQSSFVENDDFRKGGARHGFALFNDGSGFFLFRRDAKDGVSVFHIDRRFRLVAAAHEFEGERYLEMTDVAALKALQGEVEAWAHVLSPRGPVLPAAVPARILPGGNPPAGSTVVPGVPAPVPPRPPAP